MILTSDDKRRFLAYVIKKGPDNCWEWLGSTNAAGYGRFKLKGKMYYTHRVAYYLEYGVDPGKLLICHRCDNSSCCNPKHLFLGTNSDNLQDAWNKGRRTDDRKGEQNSFAKLTEKDVIEIKRLLRIGISPTIIVEQFPVKRNTIYEISRGVSWRHI